MEKNNWMAALEVFMVKNKLFSGLMRKKTHFLFTIKTSKSNRQISRSHPTAYQIYFWLLFGMKDEFMHWECLWLQKKVSQNDIIGEECKTSCLMKTEWSSCFWTCWSQSLAQYWESYEVSSDCCFKERFQNNCEF